MFLFRVKKDNSYSRAAFRATPGHENRHQNA